MTGYCLPADRSLANKEKEDEDSILGLVGLSAAVLQRHGARVLYPPAAATIADAPPPCPTVYRAQTLFVPPHPHPRNLPGALKDALADVGMRLDPVDAVDPAGPAGPAGPDDESGLPELAVLLPTGPEAGRTTPVVVDAWVALQALRAAAKQDASFQDYVDQVSLEHVLTGSALNGVPITDGGGVVGVPITDGGGITGPGAADSYLFGGGDARTPVKLYLHKPPRLSADECTDRYGRRPVVAVLDTGVRPHRWLGHVTNNPPATQPGDFLTLDNDIQLAIHENGKSARDAGDKRRRVIDNAWETPVAADPLLGELDTHTGHGTFIAGVVRQVVPDAEVLAIRVMHTDGIVYEGDLLCALKQIAARVRNAQGYAGAPAMDEMVDVVSLSMGYFSESPTATAASASSPLCRVLQTLAGYGVAAVAGAGNSSASRRFYPAAFTEVVNPVAGADPLFSVGALNPNGTKAVFSNDGKWVRAWASGAEVVSTFPVDVNGSRKPGIGLAQDPGNPLPRGVPPDVLLRPGRDALDPDDYCAGFALWSGTSFATPEVASQFVKCLLRNAVAAGAGSPLSLMAPGPAAEARLAAAANLLVNEEFWT